MQTGHRKRYGTSARVRFAFRSDARIEKQVDALMRYYGYSNYSTLFRTLIHEAYRRLITDKEEL